MKAIGSCWIKRSDSYLNRPDGRLVNVADLATDAALYADVSSRFRTELQASRETAEDKAFWELIVTYGMLEDPLDILVDGYCNYTLL